MQLYTAHQRLILLGVVFASIRVASSALPNQDPPPPPPAHRRPPPPPPPPLRNTQSSQNGQHSGGGVNIKGEVRVDPRPPPPPPSNNENASNNKYGNTQTLPIQGKRRPPPPPPPPPPPLIQNDSSKIGQSITSDLKKNTAGSRNIAQDHDITTSATKTTDQDDMKRMRNDTPIFQDKNKIDNESSGNRISLDESSSDGVSNPTNNKNDPDSKQTTASSKQVLYPLQPQEYQPHGRRPPPPPPSSQQQTRFNSQPQQQQQQPQQQYYPESTPMNQGRPYPPRRPYSGSINPQGPQGQHNLQPYQNHPPSNNYQQQQQQQQSSPQQWQMTPYTRPPPTQHRFKSFLSRINKSIDNLADIDTHLSSTAQRFASTVSSTVSSTSNTISSGVSGAVRKTVFDVTDGYTGMKNTLKDSIKGSMTRFGGAPTSSTEAIDEWEDDRRHTVWERRRKALLGDDTQKGDDHSVSNAGNTSSATGTNNSDNDDVKSPLEKHLESLVSSYPQTGTDVLEEEGDDDQQEQPYNDDIEQDYMDSDDDDDENNGTKSDLEISTPMSPFLATGTRGNGGTTTGDRSPVYNAQGGGIESDQGDNDSSYTTTTDNSANAGSNNNPPTRDVDPSAIFLDPGKTRTRPYPKQDYSNDFTEQTSTWTKIKSSVPTLRPPRLSFSGGKRLFGRGSTRLDGSGWSDDDWSISSSSSSRSSNARSNSMVSSSPKRQSARQAIPSKKRMLVEFLQSRDTQTTPTSKRGMNLLSSTDLRRSARLGRGRAIMDAIAVGFFMIMVQEIYKIATTNQFFKGSVGLPKTWDDGKRIVSDLYWVAISSTVLDSWIPYALSALILTIWTSNVIFTPMSQSMMHQLAESIKINVSHSQMYIRLLTGLPVQRNLPNTLSIGAQNQMRSVMEIVRFRSFVSMVIIGLMISSVDVVRKVTTQILSAIIEILQFDVLYSWPLEWEVLWSQIKETVIPVVDHIRLLFADEYEAVVQNPMDIAVKGSLFAGLFIVTLLPMFERDRRVASMLKKEGEIGPSSVEKEDESSEVENIGSSSAGRLNLKSHNSIESVLQQWRDFKVSSSTNIKTMGSLSQLDSALTKVGYYILSGILLLAPVILHGFTSLSLGTEDQVVKATAILLFIHSHLQKTISKLLESSIYISQISRFFQTLRTTIEEDSTQSGSTSPLQIPSSDKGISVRDLWAAYSFKRAWACRGANIDCESGEVVLILGDESSGKTQILTAISECILFPTRQSRSTTLARGKVVVGGVETSSWDKSQLKSRVGILLNDVRTLSDSAALYSGCTLSEILDPLESRNNGKDAVSVAMELVGLSSAPNLKDPSTQVSSKEYQLRGSSTQTQLAPLSPSEWSKLMIARVIAHSVRCNDTPTPSPNSIPRSLLGSVLLLDDATSLMNELEEIHLVKALRQSGAATLITSNRWSTGRFADRIAVVKNGSIVECGTHAELLGRGPQRSVYAAKWAQMMAE